MELCGIKAVGICGIDAQTLNMTLENNYIPVVTPNDIDTEMLSIHPADTAREIAVLLQAEKLIYISRHEGVTWEENRNKILSMTESELKTYMGAQQLEADLKKLLDNAILALDGGVQRAHLLGGRIQHALLLELFSILGVGTVIMRDDRKLYDHEKGRY